MSNVRLVEVVNRDWKLIALFIGVLMSGILLAGLIVYTVIEFIL
jgi:hypothetical protein